MIIPKLEKVRTKLDKLDTKLLFIIKKRTALVDQVIKLKKNKSEIIDKKRISFILKKIKKNLLDLKLIQL